MSSSSSQESRPSLFIMVGDMSADKHASKVVAKLKQLSPGIQIWGSGGPDMVAQGFDQVYNCADYADMASITKLPKQLLYFANLRTKMVKEIEIRKPNAVLLVDFGGYNLPLAELFRTRFPELPIIYFISPQVWGSRPWRMNQIKKTVRKMLVIFPFEEKLYRDKGIEARFVGHPLTENIPAATELKSKAEFITSMNLDPVRKIICVFPGSRKGEIRDLLPVTLDAMDWVMQNRDDVQFVISQANDMVADIVKKLMAQHKFSNPSGAAHIHMARPEDKSCTDHLAYELMANADLVWAKSGTTTLEVTLFGKPMIVFYRVDWPSWLIALNFMLLRRVSWPNLLAAEDLVPELIQLDCRAEQLVRYTNDLLDVPALRQRIQERLLTLRSQLGQGDYATNCAEEILRIIQPSRSATQQSQANV
jgi:lipid-A-disaccharide synthase